MDISMLSSKGFIVIPYPTEMRRAVERAVYSWEKFCQLPVNVKQQFRYTDVSAGVGYELKDGSGPGGDHKENFDITADAYGRPGDLVLQPVVADFITAGSSLVSQMADLVLDFAVSLQIWHSIPGLAHEIRDGRHRFFVRFIHYFPCDEVGKDIASPHVDQSGFTLHLYESDPGLEYLMYDKWKPMPVSSGVTVIIPAMQLQLRSKGGLKALAHRVVSTSRSMREGRYSAVSFIQLDGPKYDKETHGRLQEKPVGFNYEMPHEEFSKLFK